MAPLSQRDGGRHGERLPEEAPRSGIIRRVRDDLRGGRNVELYLTVTLSLCIAILSVFDVVNIKVVGAATLAVLALLAASGVASRHQAGEIRGRLDQLTADISGDVPADRFLKPRMPALDDEMAAATEIGLVGVTLTRTVRDLLPTLDRRLRKGASIRVVVIDPEGSARADAVARSRGADKRDFYQPRLDSTIDLLRVLASAAPDESALELRVLPYVPTFGMCLVDPGEAHGRIHVEMYQHQTIEKNPSFSLRADRDNPWYQLFARQFETLWDGARPFQLIVTE
jgi:hypothetical protein